MRAALCRFLMAVLLTAGLAAQTAPRSDAGLSLPPLTRAPGQLPPLELPKLVSSSPKPMEELDAFAFFPSNPIINLATALPEETRSSTQLEALLATYAGTWRGESTWCSLSTHQTIRLPTEVVYRIQKQDGRNVLIGTITYQRNGAPIVGLSRLWVENGHIFSESTQNGLSQKYVAQSRGQSLAWCAYGSMETLLGFSEVETLRLTADGGQISSHGCEVRRNLLDSSIVLETTELKLAK